MYGHIHIILKDLVLSVADAETWQSILTEAGLVDAEDEARALDTVVHSDDLTFGLVGATCRVLGLTLDDALRTFGHHFVGFALRSGHAPFLKSQGATLHAFLANVNNLHSHLERDHPNARFPFIESKYDPEQDSVDLLYLSVRTGLKSLVMGVVEEVGIRLYGLIVSFEELPVPEDLQDAHEVGHTAAWRVTWRPRPGGPKPLTPTAARAELPKMSFFALHDTFVEVMKIARNAVSCCSEKPRVDQLQSQPKETERSVVPEESILSDSDEELVMCRLSTMRKRMEVDSSNEDIPLEHILMRATRASKVAAAWSDASLAGCRAFWEDSAGSWEHYELSEDARSVDVFVSHSWSPPENWKLVMGQDICYADVKSTALAITAKDVVLTKSVALESWGNVTLWVDKACIPQDDVHLKESCISLIEKFIWRADRVCVLFTWSYLERLWCVFEWACVLTDKDPNKIWLQNDVFVTEQSFPLYLECIRYFSLKRTKCYLESDRSILTAKIDSCYVSHKAFERLVKATAIALMARSMAYRAGRSKRLHERFFHPWVELAEESGFSDLAQALDTCKPQEWRALAVSGGTPKSKALQPVLLGRAGHLLSIKACKYHDHISAWFDEKVNPVLVDLRKEVVKR